MRLLTTAILLALTPTAFAAEGMWTLDNLPRATLAERYGFKPDAQWLQHAQHSAVRLAGGCSGSFVSKTGLVLTNHHCVLDCVQDLSSAENDYVNRGFLAAKPADELQCPGMEVNRLDSITDVTARIAKATEGLSGKAYNDAKKAEQSKIEAECVGKDAKATRCDVVELYQGGVQHLYRYARFQDVRLAFAPEFAAGFFGGDPDNFNFPRYNLDMALLRVWQDGKPLPVKSFFPIKRDGAQVGELVMTLGHPGSTQRLLTVAQLETLRDVVLPFRLLFAAEFRGLLTRFADENAENARIVQSDLVSLENGFKARSGMHRALLDAQVMADKRRAENELRDYVNGDAERAAKFGDPWQAVAQAEQRYRDMYVEYALLESGFGFLSQQIDWAKTLVRGAAERAKPDGERLREFAEAGLPAVQAKLLAEVPFYPDYEKVKLGWSLAKLREKLGADHPLVRAVLGKESPASLAAAIVDGSQLADREQRKALWEGGSAAIDASNDPAIALYRRIDSAARAIRARYETEVESVNKRSAEQLAQARFARHGTSVYPDATFSLRLSHGVIGGWQEAGQDVPAYTVLGGMFDRASEHEPYRVAAKWQAARDRLDPNIKFNQVSDNDIIGGNSGSPLINAKGELVGLIFDGNIHSLGGAYFFDGSRNRAVSVHPQAMAAGLREVYGAEHLAKELGL